MKNIRLSLLLLISVISVNVFGQDIDYKGFPEWSWGKKDSTEYMLYTPKNMEPGKIYPVALFMHGCCGKSYAATERNAVDPPARMWHNFGANTQKIPTYIISGATSRGWSQHFDNLKEVIDDLVKNGQADPQRIYVTGFSMGGGGTWQIIQEYPGYFAAALPMGMDFEGDHGKVNDLPIWTNQGKDGWYSKGLKDNVSKIRAKNNYTIEGGGTWVTGVNPRYSSFEGVGHGVQWIAASTQDLVGWAYTKINDGNSYPNVYFESPSYKESQQEGANIEIIINAEDPDGRISKVEVYVAGKLLKSIKRAPYKTRIKAVSGDTKIEAVAYDNRGKKSTATTIVRVNCSPEISTSELPYSRAGALYQKQLFVRGNGPFSFSMDYTAEEFPKGLSLNKNGEIKGVPVIEGTYTLPVIVTDDNGLSIKKEFVLDILTKRENEIVVTRAMNKFKGVSPISKIRLGETLNYNTGGNEINFSELNGLDELTLIKTDSRDVEVSGDNYLSFGIDKQATVYVGYEKFDNRYTSTIPEWLQEWKKVDNEVVAQYRYFNLFKKTFPRGKVSLPGGDIKKNKLSTNYFVLVESIGNMKYSPEISTQNLPQSNTKSLYIEELTCLYGKGEVVWKVLSGKLPEGLVLSEKGIVSGLSLTAGTFDFTVSATDTKGQSDTKKFQINVK